MLAAIDDKIAGNEIAESVAPAPAGGQIIDLMEALRASLGGKKPARAGTASPAPAAAEAPAAAKASRKAPKRAAPTPAEEAPAPARAARGRK